MDTASAADPLASLFQPMPTVAAVVLGAFTVVWLISVWRRNAGIVDIVWGPAFALAAWAYALASDVPLGDDLRTTVALTLVTVWALRLAGHIAWRSRGHGEDYRYQTFRKRSPQTFWWRSLFTVFWLQAALALLIAAPFYVILGTRPAVAWAWTDTLAVALWLIGFTFEAVGDLQLARFKADPANKGKVLDSGLWSLTRHPNYFGDATLWWGYFCFALALPLGPWTVFGPLLMTLLLMKVSGVALLERTIHKRRPAYQAYIESTPAFFPWPSFLRKGSP